MCIKPFLLFFLACCSTGLFAQTTTSSYSCPNTYITVQLGDSVDKVRAACGDPTTASKRVEPVSSTINTLQWIYTSGQSLNGRVSQLPVLVISFRNQQVTKIENLATAGLSVPACSYNGSINLGDSQDSVLLACGRPSLVSTKQETDPNPQTKEVTEWVYNYGPYKPQIIFDFEGGALKQIITGALGK